MGTVIRKDVWGKEFESPEALEHWLRHGQSRKERIATCLDMSNRLFKNCDTVVCDVAMVQEMTRKNLRLMAESWLATARDHASKETGWTIELMVEGEWKLITPESAEIIPIRG